jgi:hypothetical protein
MRLTNNKNYENMDKDRTGHGMGGIKRMTD